MNMKLTDEERERRKKIWQKKSAHNYYERNKQKIREKQYEWRVKNPEKVKEYARKYYRIHCEEINAKRKALYIAKKGKTA